MKITLAIDTSTNRTQVALLEGAELIWSESFEGATEHTENLIKMVNEALLIRKNIDQVVVGMGPGPFTGLRAGIAFAKSFAFARNLIFKGVCSLDAIAKPIPEDEFIVATDARRKEIYWAHYRNGARISGPNVTSPTALPNIKVHYSFPDLKFFPELDHVDEPLYLRHPDAVPTLERNQ